MEWKLLRAGDKGRCKCGRTTFVEVGIGRVIWFAALPNNTPAPEGVDFYRCGEKRCEGHRRYVAVSMPADQVVEPPSVAA